MFLMIFFRLFWLAFWAWLVPLRTRPPKRTALDRGVETGTATAGTIMAGEAAGETTTGADGEIVALLVFVVIPAPLKTI